MSAKMRNGFRLLIAAAMIVFALGFSGLDAEAKSGKWEHDRKGWWYSYSDGTYAKNTWLKLGGKWYRFNAAGYMVVGWKKVSGRWYYFGKDGAMQTGWKKISGDWYYMDANGMMVVGWKEITGKSGKDWYFFKNGVMQTGWKKIQGKWYYFHPSTGAAAKEATQISGKTYYFNKTTREMDSGWRWAGLIRTYFDPKTGEMARGWRKIDGDWYYFYKDGSRPRGIDKIGKYFYYFNGDGKMQTNTLIGDSSKGSLYVGSDGAAETIRFAAGDDHKGFEMTLYANGTFKGSTWKYQRGLEYGEYAKAYDEFIGTFSDIKYASEFTLTMKLSSYKVRGYHVYRYMDPNTGKLVSNGVESCSNDPYVVPDGTGRDELGVDSEFTVGDTFYVYAPRTQGIYLVDGFDEGWCKFDNSRRLTNVVIDNPKNQGFKPFDGDNSFR